jgi:hypothetical protein
MKINLFSSGKQALFMIYTIGTEASFEEIKLPECEADHSLLSSAEVKNDGNISPLSHMPSWYGA